MDDLVDLELEAVEKLLPKLKPIQNPITLSRWNSKLGNYFTKPAERVEEQGLVLQPWPTP